MYDFEQYTDDTEKINELLSKIESCCPGYKRKVIALACARMIAAMLGPAEAQTREDFLQRFPGLMHSLWRMMDHELHDQAKN